MHKERQLSILLTVFFFLGGCVHTHYPDAARLDTSERAGVSINKNYLDNVKHLENELSSLGSNVDKNEARLVAEVSVRSSLSLAEEYRVIRPAIFHNVLVNLGMRDRGLCVHWTEDLLEILQELQLQSFDLHWGVAHRGESWRVEHSSVVITAKEQAFDDGIILDPWRYSGRLYWSRIRNDRYPWKELRPE
jgi:hypothetical protein